MLGYQYALAADASSAQSNLGCFFYDSTATPPTFTFNNYDSNYNNVFPISVHFGELPSSKTVILMDLYTVWGTLAGSMSVDLTSEDTSVSGATTYSLLSEVVADFVTWTTDSIFIIPFRFPQSDPGPTGPAGADGSQGVSGSDGATGPQGADGLTGPQGLAGADGAAGVTGPQGVPGADGAAGATGPQGLVGTDGATGPQGAEGATGPQGVAGTDGATGPTGPTFGVAAVVAATGSNQTFASTDPQVVTFNDAAVAPTSSDLSLATGNAGIVCNTAGVYQITGRVNWTSTSSSLASYQLQVRIGGVVTHSIYSSGISGGGSANDGQTITVVASVPAATTVDLVVVSANTDSVSLVTSGPGASWLGVNRLA